MKFSNRSMFSLCAAVTLVCGCAQSSDEMMGVAPLELPNVLVDAGWLSTRLSDPRLVVLDAREPAEYAAGHIEGAINLPKSRLLNPTVADGNKMAAVGVIQRLFSEAGIDADRTVVIYDGNDYRDAARTFWILEVHGHQLAGVLNGGFPAWKDAGLPVSTTTTTKEPRLFVAMLRPSRFSTKLTVRRAIDDSSTMIIDGRSANEYRGLVSEASRKGHIPNAISIDYQRNLVSQKPGVCTVELPEDLVTLYRSQLTGETRVVCYCNVGSKACVNYLALRSLGFAPSVYEGSWQEWGNDPKLPIVSSDDPGFGFIN